MRTCLAQRFVLPRYTLPYNVFQHRRHFVRFPPATVATNVHRGSSMGSPARSNQGSKVRPKSKNGDCANARFPLAGVSSRCNPRFDRLTSVPAVFIAAVRVPPARLGFRDAKAVVDQSAPMVPIAAGFQFFLNAFSSRRFRCCARPSVSTRPRRIWSHLTALFAWALPNLRRMLRRRQRNHYDCARLHGARDDQPGCLRGDQRRTRRSDEPWRSLRLRPLIGNRRLQCRAGARSGSARSSYAPALDRGGAQPPAVR